MRPRGMLVQVEKHSLSEKVSHSLVKHVPQIREHKKGIDRAVYGPYLLLLQPQQLAVLTLHGAQPDPGSSVLRLAQYHVCDRACSRGFHGFARVPTSHRAPVQV